MVELDPDDIKASWVESGTWSGTVSTTDYDGNKVSLDIDHKKYTVAEVKANFTKAGIDLGIVGTEIDCRVYSNVARTKLLLKQTITVKAGDEKKSKTVRWDLEKD